MNRWMWKSTLREIRASLGRYMAILAIIALGVGFFCGLKVVREAMLLTGDEYLEKQAFYDEQLYSPLGFSAEDAEAIEDVSGVVAADAAYSEDFIITNQEGNDVVMKALSITDDVNLPNVIAGRMPEKANECLGDRRYFTEDDIGSTVLLADTNAEETLDAFAYEEYTVVGLADSPLYLNFERGSTSIGSGQVAGFVLIPEDGFNKERYDDIYVRLDTGETAYSEDYDEAEAALVGGVEAALEERVDLRRDEILKEYEDGIEEARQELEDGRAEYEKGKKEAEQELSDALKQITDGEAELEEARTQIADGEAALAEAEAQIEDGEAAIEEARGPLEEGQAQLDDGYAQLDAAQAELDPQAEEVRAQRELFDQEKAAAYEQIDAAEAEYTAMYEQAMEVLKTSEDWEERLEALYDLVVAKMALEEIETQRAQADEQFDAAEAELIGYETQIADAQAEIDAGRAELDEKAAQLAAGLEELEAKEQELAAGRAEIETRRAELESGKQELAQGEQELADARKKYEEGKEESEEKLAEAKAKLEEGEAEFAKAEDDYNTLKEELTAHDLSYVMDRETNTGYVCFDNDTAIVDGIANVFPIFFFLVAILVCMTTMTRMIDEQRTQIGVLKALGYSRESILSKYLIYAGSAAVLGSVIGFFAGSLAFPWVIWETYGIMYGFADLIFVFNPVLALISLAAALLCSVGATWISGRTEFVNVPAQLMRPKSPKAGKRIFLERIPWIWGKLSFLQKVSVRNIVRYKKRVVMMIMGIGGCTALVLTGFGIKDSIQNIVSFQYDEITTYDYSVAFTEGMDADDIENFDQEISGVDGRVFVYTGTYDVTANGSTKSISLIGADSLTGFVDLHTRAGEPVAFPNDGEVVLTQKFADTLGIKTGDTVTFSNTDSGTLSLKVSGICENYVYSYAYVNLDSFETQWGEIPALKGAFVNAAEGQDIHNVGANLANYDKTISVMVSDDMKTRFASMLQSLDYVVLFVIACAGALAFVVLYNLTNINITERMREIATIKVLGFYPKECASYIFRENYMLTFVSGLVGLVLGKFLHAFVMSQIQIDAVAFDVRVEPLSYLLALVITFVFALIVSRAMRVKINRINMAESLKSIE